MTGMAAAHDPGPEPRGQLDRLLEEDPADLYENAPMGYLSTLPDGRIVKVNRTFCVWTGRPAEGVPDNPKGWLITTASRRRIEMWRSDSARTRPSDSTCS